MSTTVTNTEPTDDQMLRELSDRISLDHLVRQVGANIDEGRFDDLRGIYTSDVEVATPGGTAHGLDALVAQVSANHDPSMRVQHLIAAPTVELTGDQARLRAPFVATFSGLAPMAEPTFRMGGVYRFDARRTEAGWLLASVAIEPGWALGVRPVPLARPSE